MQTSTRQFEFTGQTGEFFKIWIVNVMLSIITLGIYSAWAKVRTKRYFYNNILLMNTPFDYLADPVRILKGRALAFILIVLYSLSGMLSPAIQGIIAIVFFAVLPWIIIRALKFSFYNTAYRNIRFHFDAEYLSALGVFVGLAILIPLTLGLAYPAFVRARKKFVIDHCTYGTSRFEMTASNGQFYGIYMNTSAVTFALVLVVWGLFAVLQSSLNLAADMEEMAGLVVLAILTMLPLFVVVYGYLYTATANLVINHTRLRQFGFESTMKTAEICWLYFVNTLAIIFSLGLLIPWAMIRTAHYRISRLALVGSGDINAFIAGETETAGALGEELDDLLDLDIGL